MLIDFISTSNYGYYNVKLANILGLETAVYLNELLNINEKAIRKNTISDCYFKLDRTYIKSRTTIDEEAQIGIDNELIKLELLYRKENNYDIVMLDLEKITGLLISDDDELKKGIEKLIKVKKRKSKTESLSDNLKRFVDSGNIGVDNALKDWIDVIVDKFGRFNKTGVQETQSKIINASNGNPTKAIDILKIATINEWKDIDYAINVYNEKHKNEKNLTAFGQNVIINKDIKF